MDSGIFFKESSFVGLFAIKCPLEKTLDCFSRLGWFVAEGDWAIKSKTIAAHTNLLEVLDLSESTYNYNPPETNMMWEPCNAPGTTIFRTTLEDCHSSLFHCQTKTGLEAFLIRICNQKGRAAYTFWRRNGDRRSERCVQYIQDSPRSEFYVEGNPLPFENVAYYSRRLKKRRINADIILEYMNALGWNMTDDAFWSSDKPAYYEIRQFTGKIASGSSAADR